MSSPVYTLSSSPGANVFNNAMSNTSTITSSGSASSSSSPAFPSPSTLSSSAELTTPPLSFATPVSGVESISTGLSPKSSFALTISARFTICP